MYTNDRRPTISPRRPPIRSSSHATPSENKLHVKLSINTCDYLFITSLILITSKGNISAVTLKRISADILLLGGFFRNIAPDSIAQLGREMTVVAPTTILFNAVSSANLIRGTLLSMRLSGLHYGFMSPEFRIPSRNLSCGVMSERCLGHLYHS